MNSLLDAGFSLSDVNQGSSKKDPDCNYNYPDCYLNVAIGSQKLKKMVMCANFGVTKEPTHKEKGYISNGKETVSLNFRDKRIMSNVAKATSRLRSLLGLHNYEMYQPSLMLDLLKTDLYSKTDSLFFQKAIETSGILTDVSIKSLDNSFNSHLVTTEDFSDVKHYNSELFQNLVINHSQLETKGALWSSFLDKRWEVVDGKLKIIRLLIQDYTFLLAPDLVIIKKTNLNPVIFGREVLLMMSDLAQERYFVEVATIVASRFGLLNYPSLDLIRSVFNWGDNLLLDLGNEGYSIISVLEPITLYQMMRKKPDVFDDTSFYMGVTEGMTDVEKTYVDQLIMILRNSENDHQLGQIFGLYRLWGHPYVNVKNGLAKIRRLAALPKTIEREPLRQGTREFKINFINCYLSKEGRWPNLLGNLTITKLKMDCKKILYNINCTNEDLDSIQFLKTFDYQIDGNISSLLSDKTISLTLDELVKSLKEQGTIGRSEDRRAILKLITDPLFDVKQLLKDLDEKGFALVQKLIGLLEKERELKNDPRLFAILPYVPRMYFVSTEDMIAQHILKYFPQVTKSWSENQLKQTFVDWTSSMNPHVKKNKIPIVLNMDFEKWNTNMRSVITDEYFQMMDHLMGYNNLIKRTHSFFSEAKLYSASADAELETTENDLKENDYCWSGHLGGLEGLRQGGWTVVTVCLLLSFCRSKALEFRLIGQGDNQVLQFSIPVTQEQQTQLSVGNYSQLRLIVQEIKNDLISFMAQVGLPLKAKETWESSRLFVYGKEIIMSGVPISMDLKRISRMYGAVNSPYPSTDVIISNIFASGVGATNNTIVPIVPYFMAVFSSSIELQRLMLFHPLLNSSAEEMIRKAKSPVFRFNFKNSSEDSRIDYSVPKHKVVDSLMDFDKYLIYNLLKPKSLGGFGVQLYPYFFLRGFPDSGYTTISFLKNILLVSHNELICSQVRSLLLFKKNPEISPTLLFENPDSLNLIGLSSGLHKIKEITGEIIKQDIGISNNMFKEMLRQGSDGLRELCDQLFKLDPLPVLFIADLLDATVPGYANKVISQVEKATTMRKLVMDKGGALLRDSLDRLEGGAVVWSFASKILIESDFDMNVADIDWDDLTDFLVRWRSSAWGKNIDGVTVPHPLALLHPSSDGNKCDHCMANRSVPCEKPENDYFVVCVSDSMVMNPYVAYSRVENYSPYLGSNTSEKVEAWTKKSTFKQAMPLMKKAANIQKLVGWWIKFGSPANDFVDNLWYSVTDENPRLYDSSSQLISGSVFHRYHSTRINRGGFYSGLFGPLTFLNASSNHITTFSRGAKNVMFHFQSAFIHIQSLLVHRCILNSTQRLTNSYHFHMRTHKALPILEDDFLTGNEQWRYIRFPKGQPPFTYFPSSQLKIQHHNCTQILTPLTRRLNDPLVLRAVNYWLGLRIAISIHRDSFDLMECPWDKMTPLSLSGASKLDLSKVLDSIACWLIILLIRNDMIYGRKRTFMELRLQASREVSQCSDANLKPLAWFFARRDMWYHWCKTLSIITTEYPCNQQTILRGLNRSLLSRCQDLNEINFYDIINYNFIITNDSSFWDYEANFKIVSYMSEKYLKGIVTREDAIHLVKNDNLLSYIEKVSRLIVAPYFDDDFRYYKSAFYGSFESIVKDFDSFQLIQPPSLGLNILSPLGQHRSFHWTNAMGERGGSPITYNTLTSELPPLDPDFTDLMMRNFFNREPRGPTSSFLKYYYMLSNLDFCPDRAVVIGDGTGGTSRAVLSAYAHCLVNSYTKKFFDQLDPCFSEPSMPFEHVFISSAQMNNLNINNHTLESPGDLHDSNLQESIQHFLRKGQNTRQTMLLIDIEGRDIINASIYPLRISEIINISKPDFLIFKTYLDVSFNLVNLLNHLSLIYEDVSVQSIVYSSLTNREIFIICNAFTRPYPPNLENTHVNSRSAFQFRRLMESLSLPFNISTDRIALSLDWKLSAYNGITYYHYLLRLLKIPMTSIWRGESYSLLNQIISKSRLVENRDQKRKELTTMAEIMLVNTVILRLSGTSANKISVACETLRTFKVGYYLEEPYIRTQTGGSFFSYSVNINRLSYRKKLLLRFVSYLSLLWRRIESDDITAVVRVDESVRRRSRLGLYTQTVRTPNFRSI